MKTIVTSVLVLTCFFSRAQDSTRPKQKLNPFSFHGHVEVYYSYDFNKPIDNKRPAFIYSHNRHNEFNANLAFLKVSYNPDRVRANIAIAVGTFMNANYAAEPGVLKNIYEANAGVKISKNRNLWLDAGVFSSHIGFESAYSPSSWTLTRSMLADNSPYYESGVKLTYISDNGIWLFSGLALNGWQRIQRVSANSLMSWGSQIQVRPSKNVLLNYSTFLGTDKPDSARLWRYFHNLYGIFQINDKFGLTFGFDIGHEQVAKGSGKMNTWFTPIAIIRYMLNENWAITARVEYYQDENGVIITTGAPNGFKNFGASLNVDRTIGKNFWWRSEIRAFKSKDAIFAKDGNLVNNNAAFTTSIALTF